MKVRVTKQDIDKGRSVAKDRCGCPIWHALNRTLGLKLESIDTTVLKVSSMEQAVVRSKEYPLIVTLSSEAQELQRLLRALPNAPVKPFSFTATVKYAGDK